MTALAWRMQVFPPPLWWWWGRRDRLGVLISRSLETQGEP